MLDKLRKFSLTAGVIAIATLVLSACGGYASGEGETFDYPDGGVFFSILWIFLFVIWIWLLFTVFTDLFRDHETNGWVKALWVLLVIILPYLGVLLYLIVRGRGMGERAVAAQKEAQDQFAAYVRDTAGGNAASEADEIAKFAELHEKGALTDEEFAAKKAAILGNDQ